VQKSYKAMMAITLMCLAASLACAQGSFSAMDVLASVGTAYSSMSTFQGEGTVQTVMNGPGMQQNMEMPVELTLAAPNKLRLNLDSPTMKAVTIFDGQIFWMYFPALNMYSKLDQASLPSADKTRMKGYDLFSKYRDIAQRVEDARILKSETVNLNGAPAECWVIEVHYKNPHAGSGSSAFVGGNSPKVLSSQATLWVTKDQDWVVKTISATDMKMNPSASPAEMTVTLAFNKITANEPLADSLFTFTPPAGAREMNLSQFIPSAKSAAH
jgi:outer membrane lipoprotein-sorting protein